MHETILCTYETVTWWYMTTEWYMPISTLSPVLQQVLASPVGYALCDTGCRLPCWRARATLVTARARLHRRRLCYWVQAVKEIMCTVLGRDNCPLAASFWAWHSNLGYISSMLTSLVPLLLGAGSQDTQAVS